MAPVHVQFVNHPIRGQSRIEEVGEHIPSLSPPFPIRPSLPLEVGHHS